MRKKLPFIALENLHEIINHLIFTEKYQTHKNKTITVITK